MKNRMSKQFGIIGFLFVYSFALVAQNITPNDSDSIILNSFTDSELNIDQFNFCDTAKNEFAAYMIKSGFKRYSLMMKGLKEDLLSDTDKNEQKIFRILSQPSFNHPICLTISSVKDQKYLSWTIGKSTGGYEPGGIKKKGKTKMSIKDWSYFKQLIDLDSIDTLPLVTYFPMTDGTSWIIEKNIEGKHKIYFSNILSSGLENGFALLLHISGIKTQEGIHFYDNNTIRFFDSNNTLINLNPFRASIINHLNKDFSTRLSDENYCFDCGLYVKINAGEKLKSVKYIPYMLPHRTFAERFEYFQENYQDRRFLHLVKRSLEEIDFTKLNLSNAIWIPVYIKYNKEKELLEIE